MKSFSKWAGDTHYANMDELTQQVDDGHQERVATIKERSTFPAAPPQPAPAAPPQPAPVVGPNKGTINKAAAALHGGARTKFKQFAAMGDDANVSDASNSRRRNTLLATLQTLGYEDKQTLMSDVRMIASHLNIPGADQVEGGEGVGGDTQADEVQPTKADGNGLSGHTAGTPTGG